MFVAHKPKSLLLLMRGFGQNVLSMSDVSICRDGRSYAKTPVLVCHDADQVSLS
jgi:hypothetical protein